MFLEAASTRSTRVQQTHSSNFRTNYTSMLRGHLTHDLLISDIFIKKAKLIFEKTMALGTPRNMSR